MLFSTNDVRFEPDRLANVISSVVEMKVNFFLRNDVFKRVDVFRKGQQLLGAAILLGCKWKDCKKYKK